MNRNRETGPSNQRDLDRIRRLEALRASEIPIEPIAELAAALDVQAALEALAAGMGAGGAAWGDITGTLSDQVDLQTALDALASEALVLTAGAGLTGGGDLTANRSFDVGAGTGIIVNADDVAIDLTAEAERIRDTIGTALVAGTNITITPNDGGDTITIEATGGGNSGAVYLATASAGTVGTSTASQDLISYSLPGATVGDGDAIRVTAHGRFAAVARSKTVRLSIAGTLFGGVTVTNTTDINWSIEATLTRISATTLTGIVRTHLSNSGGTVTFTAMAPSLAVAVGSLAGAQPVKITGQVTTGTPATNDVVADSMVVEVLSV